MAEKDHLGRYVSFNIELDKGIHTGHAVCNYCAKDMPVCWDTVCSGCYRTFCYDHSALKHNRWYCPDCFARRIIEAVPKVINIERYLDF